MFSHEEIAALERAGLSGQRLNLHLTVTHLVHSLWSARDAYQAYFALWQAGHNTREDRALPVHHFKLFFGTVQKSLWDRSIMSLAHLLEADSKTLNIRSVLEDVEENARLLPDGEAVRDTCVRCRERLASDEAKSLTATILKYRHNVVAHRSYKLPNEMSAFRVAPVTIGTPRRALELVTPVVSRLSGVVLGRSDRHDSDNVKRELEQLLDQLARHLVRVSHDFAG